MVTHEELKKIKEAYILLTDMYDIPDGIEATILATATVMRNTPVDLAARTYEHIESVFRYTKFDDEILNKEIKLDGLSAAYLSMEMLTNEYQSRLQRSSCEEDSDDKSVGERLILPE